MTRNELFAKGWLYIYTAALKNIGFDVRCVDDEPSSEQKTEDRSA